MVTVALHTHSGNAGRQWRTTYKPYPSNCRAEGGKTFAKILGIMALTALFFLLAYALPINRANAAETVLEEALQLLPYEKAPEDSIAPGKDIIAKAAIAPQMREYKDMNKKDQKAVLAQFAVGAIGHAFYTPLARALNAVQEPIRSDDGNFVCRTKLSFSSAYMRCGLKF